MEIRVTFSPGVSPIDRGWVEDQLVEALTRRLGEQAECLGGGTMMDPEGGAAESDFDLSCTSDDSGAVEGVCRDVFGAIPFTLTTRFEVSLDDRRFEVVVTGSEDPPE